MVAAIETKVPELATAAVLLDRFQRMVRKRSAEDLAELLEAELEEEDDVLVYEVELLTADGTVRELELDARDGRILKDEVED